MEMLRSVVGRRTAMTTASRYVATSIIQQRMHEASWNEVNARLTFERCYGYGKCETWNQRDGELEIEHTEVQYTSTC